DPKNITYPIPGNDDAIRSIDLYCELMADAVLDGIREEMTARGVDVGAAEEAPAEDLEAVEADPLAEADPAAATATATGTKEGAEEEGAKAAAAPPEEGTKEGAEEGAKAAPTPPEEGTKEGAEEGAKAVPTPPEDGATAGHEAAPEGAGAGQPASEDADKKDA
ncbi:MAG: 30S ribosomal protein S2, partial [Alphaproteobacteria bacterium]